MKDRLSSIAIAGPLVENQNAGEVAEITDALQHFIRQVVERQTGAVLADVEQSQLLAALARNLRACQLEPQFRSVLDKPVGYFDHLNLRHGQTKLVTKSGREHLVRQHSDVLRIVLKFGHIAISIGRL